MKTHLTHIIASLTIVLAASFGVAAQDYTSHIRTLDSLSFNKIEVALDTQVILLQTGRNRVTLAGESDFIDAIPVNVTDGVLSLGYEMEPEKKLYRIVIEFDNIEQIKTGGEGEYHILKLNLDKLAVMNPSANLTISGSAQKMMLVSPQGYTDISGLQAANKYLKIGDAATLVNSKEDAELFVANF